VYKYYNLNHGTVKSALACARIGAERLRLSARQSQASRNYCILYSYSSSIILPFSSPPLFIARRPLSDTPTSSARRLRTNRRPFCPHSLLLHLISLISLSPLAPDPSKLSGIGCYWFFPRYLRKKNEYSTSTFSHKMDAPTSVTGITLGCRGSEVAVRVVSMTRVAVPLP
jgi:hypothetical protein